jgi:hypothetical protein
VRRPVCLPLLAVTKLGKQANCVVVVVVVVVEPPPLLLSALDGADKLRAPADPSAGSSGAPPATKWHSHLA